MSTTHSRSSQTVLVTGTSSGFGLAMVRHFAERDWNVIATMRDPSRGPDLPSSDRILVTKLDVEDRGSIETAIAEGIARFGRIDALVNNAGYGLFAVFEAASREAVQEQFDVNVFGLMDVTRAILPHFRTNRAGTIVNITSGAGVFGAPMASIYSASKFAVEGFSEALWYELQSLGIRVKVVEPGGAPDTNFMARMAGESEKLRLPSDYVPFVSQISQAYAGMASGSDKDAVRKVVRATYDAVTDGSDRLRYQPTDDIRPIVEARRSKSEDEYQSLLRSVFVPQA